MIVTGSVELDWNKVPEVEKTTLCRTLYECAERFFENPEVQAEFEAWRKARNH